jgi:hypothetical protein
VNDRGDVAHLVLGARGATWVVNWYCGGKVEAEDSCETWEEAVQRANDFKDRLLQRGFRECTEP